MISALISYICLCVFALGVTGILVIGPMIIALQDENCYFLSIIQVFFGMFDILLVLASLGIVSRRSDPISWIYMGIAICNQDLKRS